MSVITLFKAFASGMSDYIQKHNANYSQIETTINQLLSLVTGQMGGSWQVPDGLKQIFDRKGIIGVGSFDFNEATLSGPSYNLPITAGAFWDGVSNFFSKISASVISLTGKTSGTWYVNLDSAGNPIVEATEGTNCVRSFDWDGSTVSNKTLINAILFDGDDYADCLTSAARGKDFESLATRLEEMEQLLATMGGYYAHDHTNALDFYYQAGEVRNDSDIYQTVAAYVSCVNNTTNYMEVDPASGVVSINQVGFTSGLIPLWELITDSGAITEMNDKRTWCSAGGGGGGGGGGHTQNTDLGTSSDTFTLARTQSGTPSLNATLAVERGTSPNVGVRWNEATDRWQYTNDGTNWYNLGDLNIDLGGQLITKFVSLENPPKVLEQISRSSSSVYEDLDLSGYITAPLGVEAVMLQVFFWDETPGPTVKVKFKKKDSLYSPAFAYSSWMNEMQPVTLMVPVDSDLFAQFFATASAAGKANIQVYLLGYFEKVIGVGTQDSEYAASGIIVPLSSSVETDVTSCMNRGLVHYLKVAETGSLVTGSYDIEIFAKDTYLDGDLLYKATNIYPAIDFIDSLPWFCRDTDGTSELHVRITNNDLSAQGTYDVTIKAEKFA